MNKIIIYLRQFIQTLFCISSLLGIILTFWVSSQQKNDTAQFLKEVYQGIEQNYIINVRPIVNQFYTACNIGEIPISIKLKQNAMYDLDQIQIGEENNKQMIRLCIQLRYNYNFIELKQKTQEQNDCFYKGFSIKSHGETNKCPLSDIKFSTEESIPNYEKIIIGNTTNLNLFIKRSDKNGLPIINLYLSKENPKQKKSHKIQNTSFTMDDICQVYYQQYFNACQKQFKPKEQQYSLFYQTQHAIDCDANAEFLNYDDQYYFYNIITLHFSSWIFFDIFNISFFVYIVVLQIAYPIQMIQIDMDKKIEQINSFIVLSLQFYFTYFLYYHEIQYFSYVIKLLQGISYLSEDPFQNIYDKAQHMIQLFSVLIWSQILLFLFDLVISALSKFIQLYQQHSLKKQEKQKIN